MKIIFKRKDGSQEEKTVAKPYGLKQAEKDMLRGLQEIQAMYRDFYVSGFDDKGILTLIER